MDSDKKRDATTLLAFFVFLPAIAVTLVYKLWQMRKDLTLPNRDMWE